jgi:hypothetical protein
MVDMAYLKFCGLTHSNLLSRSPSRGECSRVRLHGEASPFACSSRGVGRKNSSLQLLLRSGGAKGSSAAALIVPVRLTGKMLLACFQRTQFSCRPYYNQFVTQQKAFSNRGRAADRVLQAAGGLPSGILPLPRLLTGTPRTNRTSLVKAGGRASWTGPFGSVIG